MPWPFGGLRLDGASDFFTNPVQLLALVSPKCCDLRPEFDQAGHAKSSPFREIGTGKEGPPVVVHKDGEGPTPGAGRCLADRHINLVDIGSLLAVHFYGNEVLVEQLGHLVVLEGLVLHYVTPVAGRVSDGKEYGLIFLAGFPKSLLPPGIPIHRVFGMLQKIGAFFPCKMIGHRGSPKVWTFRNGRSKPSAFLFRLSTLLTLFERAKKKGPGSKTQRSRSA